MAYYDGPCSCASMVDPGIFDPGIISPPPHSTLIANRPVRIKWASNQTATSFSLRLLTYTGYCYDTPSTSTGSCNFSDTLEQVLLRAPDTGEAMWAPRALLESRNDYVLVGHLFDEDKMKSWIYQQGFYTILKEEDDMPVLLPGYDEIQRNLTMNASASSSAVVPTTATRLPDATSTTTTAASASVPVGAAASGILGGREGLGLLLCGLFAAVL